MSTTPHPAASSTPKPPDRAAARIPRGARHRTGQTFGYPKTRGEASHEIQRLEAGRPSSRIELELERHDVAAEQVARGPTATSAVEVNEIEGFGSTATWSRRS